MDGAVIPAAKSRAPTALDDNTEARQFAQLVSEAEISDYQDRLSYSMGPPYFAYPPQRPLVWVKSGGPRVQSEGEMQWLAWRWLRSERDAGRCNPNIHIPEVFRIFTITTITTDFDPATGEKVERKDATTFVLMQLLNATVLNKCSGSKFAFGDYCDLIAEGIQCLRRMPVPDDVMPGPYTKEPGQMPGIIRHPLFKEDEASVGYQSVDELEGHINRVLHAPRRRNGSQPPILHLERQLEFCYCDFNEENFMLNVDVNGHLRLYIVDFEHASFLPSSFLAFVLFRKDFRWTTVPRLVERIGHTLPRTNVEALKDSSRTFWTYPRSVGLKDRRKQK